MKLLILFGSSSDAPVYEPLQEVLNQCHETQFFALSAHRNAAQLKECLERESYDAVIAGAGLAAHLPGVVASLTRKPVIGIPVRAHLGGMDSLLSIVQMPGGVPVHTFASDQFSVLAETLAALEQKQGAQFHLATSAHPHPWLADKIAKVSNYCETLGISFSQGPGDPASHQAVPFHLQEETPPAGQICVPILSPEQVRERSTTMALGQLFDHPALFVGLNNVLNGFISCVQWMDLPQKDQILTQLKQGR